MDRGYDSEANHRFIRETLRANSVIPIRSWKNEVIGGTYRHEMACQFEKKLFGKIYHKDKHFLVSNAMSLIKKYEFDKKNFSRIK
jgi:hypothetical protein